MQHELKMPWVAVVSFPTASPPAETKHYIGSGRDILLEGFHWESHLGARSIRKVRRAKSWYRILEKARRRSRQRVSRGYGSRLLPIRWPPKATSPDAGTCSIRAYGSEAELRAAIGALEPVRSLADVVINHRVGIHTSGADFDDPPFADNRAAIARDDDSGAGTGNPDSGEHHPAGRDLDHTNPDVRTRPSKPTCAVLKAWVFRAGATI